MPCKYSVVQFVPDPVTGERVNLGLVAISHEEIVSRFVDDWSRIECFSGGTDIEFLREFKTKFLDIEPAQLGLSSIGGLDALTVSSLEEMAARFHNSIQFTPPAASLRDPHELLEVLAPRFLHVAEHRPLVSIPVRNRLTAARIATEALEFALELRRVSAAVRKRAEIFGKIEAYQFDAVAENGRPLIVTHGLSFEIQDEDHLVRHVDALGQAVRDVRDEHPDVSIGFVALRRPEQEKSKSFLRALRIFDAYGAAVLNEHEVRPWLTERIDCYLTRDGDSSASEGQLSVFPSA